MDGIKPLAFCCPVASNAASIQMPACLLRLSPQAPKDRFAAARPANASISKTPAAEIEKSKSERAFRSRFSRDTARSQKKRCRAKRDRHRSLAESGINTKAETEKSVACEHFFGRLFFVFKQLPDTSKKRNAIPASTAALHPRGAKPRERQGHIPVTLLKGRK